MNEEYEKFPRLLGELYSQLEISQLIAWAVEQGLVQAGVTTFCEMLMEIKARKPHVLMVEIIQAALHEVQTTLRDVPITICWDLSVRDDDHLPSFVACENLFRNLRIIECPPQFKYEQIAS